MATREQPAERGLLGRFVDAVFSPVFWLGVIKKAWTPEKYQGNFPRLHHLAAPLRFLWSVAKTVGSAAMLPIAVAGTLIKAGWKYGIVSGWASIKEARAEWKKGNRGKAILKGIWGVFKMAMGTVVIAGTIAGSGFLIATGVGAAPAAVAAIATAIGPVGSTLGSVFAVVSSGIGTVLGGIGTLGTLVGTLGLKVFSVSVSATAANVITGLLVGLPTLGIMYGISKKLDKVSGVTINKEKDKTKPDADKSESLSQQTHAKLETNPNSNPDLARKLSTTGQDANALQSTGPSTGQAAHQPLILHGQPAQTHPNQVLMPAVNPAEIQQAEALVDTIRKQDKKYEHGCSLDQNTGVITCEGSHMMEIANQVMQNPLYQGKQFTLTIDDPGDPSKANQDVRRYLEDAAKHGVLDDIYNVKIGVKDFDPATLSQMKSDINSKVQNQPIPQQPHN